MNETNNYGGEENLSFSQIVLNYLRKIIELNLRIIPENANIDFVKCYKRSVLGLSDILLPFFDDDMNCAYNKFLEDYDLMMRETTNGQVITNTSGYSSKSMNICRMLFRELNKLLNRNDYLKSNVCGEDKSEVVQEREDDEEY
jgi:hypothetical protein